MNTALTRVGQQFSILLETLYQRFKKNRKVSAVIKRTSSSHNNYGWERIMQTKCLLIHAAECRLKALRRNQSP